MDTLRHLLSPDPFFFLAVHPPLSRPRLCSTYILYSLISKEDRRFQSGYLQKHSYRQTFLSLIKMSGVTTMSLPTWKVVAAIFISLTAIFLIEKIYSKKVTFPLNIE